MAQNISCSFISFLHNEDIICSFSSLLVYLGCFQLNSIIVCAFIHDDILMGLPNANYCRWRWVLRVVIRVCQIEHLSSKSRCSYDFPLL